MLQFADGIQQFLVPLLAKATNQRIFQELIESEILLDTLCYSHLANAPTVVVQSNKSATQFLLPNGI